MAERGEMGSLFTSSHGDTFNCPVEIAEARYGQEVGGKRLNLPDPSHGVNIGGPGVITRYRMRAAATLSAGLSHATHPVWSLNPV